MKYWTALLVGMSATFAAHGQTPPVYAASGGRVAAAATEANAQLIARAHAAVQAKREELQSLHARLVDLEGRYRARFPQSQRRSFRPQHATPLVAASVGLVEPAAPATLPEQKAYLRRLATEIRKLDRLIERARIQVAALTVLI